MWLRAVFPRSLVPPCVCYSALLALCPPNPVCPPRRGLCIRGGEAEGNGWDSLTRLRARLSLCRRLTLCWNACGLRATRALQSSPDPASGHRRPAFVSHTSFNVLVVHALDTLSRMPAALSRGGRWAGPTVTAVTSAPRVVRELGAVSQPEDPYSHVANEETEAACQVTGDTGIHISGPSTYPCCSLCSVCMCH